MLATNRMKNLNKWVFDTKRLTIIYSAKGFVEKLLSLFGYPKYSVNELYSHAKRLFASERYISFSFPFESDGDRKSVHYFPRYKMARGWHIEKRDLRHLMYGPLLSEDGQQLLVQKDTIKENLRKHSYQLVFVYIAGAVAIIQGVIYLVSFIKHLQGH